MKYWLYFVAKLLAGAGILLVLEALVAGLYPVPPEADPNLSLFMHDLPFTFLIIGTWLIGAGMLFLIVWDQRRRCRTCLRTLIMPIATGSWGHVVFGRPQTQSICKYGHGTLTIEELQITGRQLPDWQPHDDDIWKELESYYQARE